MIIQEGSVFSPKYNYGFELDGIAATCIESFYCALHFGTLGQQQSVAGAPAKDARALLINFGASQPGWWRKTSPWGGVFLVELKDLVENISDLMFRAYRAQARGSGIKAQYFKLGVEPFEDVEVDTIVPKAIILNGLFQGRIEAHK